MASSDGEGGVKLGGFIKMWESDGIKLVEQEKVKKNGHVWLLYAAYYPESTLDYGRHSVILMKVDSKTDEILLHDCRNISGEVNKNYRQGIDEWFKEHVGKY